MTAVLSDADLTIHLGDALGVLRALPAESVHCCITSPPFFGLRDYGVEGQIGLEDSPDEWVARLVDVFREVRRVLRSDGTCWVECGDSYDSGTRVDRSPHSNVQKNHGYWENEIIRNRVRTTDTKAKDLLGQPWLLAFALRADGWWLRQAIIWAKPNAMPESVTDRCTTAHSYVFLLAKSARYFFDADAIREPAEWARWGDQTTPKHNGTETASGWVPERTKTEIQEFVRSRETREAEVGVKGYCSGTPNYTHEGGKNARSVWTIPTRGYPDAHFATFPEELVRRCLLAGCPEGGTVLDPFFGSGTTGLVARKHGRRAIGIELSEPYCQLASRRLAQQSIFPEIAS